MKAPNTLLRKLRLLPFLSLGIMGVALSAATIPTTQLNPMLSLNIASPHATSFAQAQADGFTWARLDADWQYVEASKGVYNWSVVNSTCALCLQYNIKPHWIIDYGNSLYGTSYSAAGQTAFVNFATAMVNQVKSQGLTGCHWEIWNEPENFPWVNTIMTPAQVAALNNAVVGPILSADPTAFVSTSPWGSIGDNINPVFSAGMDSSANFSAVGVHTYWLGDQYGSSEGEGNDNPECLFAGSHANFVGTVQSYVPSNNNFWQTETGISFSLDAGSNQDKFSYEWVRTILCDWMVGFQFINVYDDTDPDFGLIPKGKGVYNVNSAIAYLTSITKNRTIMSMTTPIASGSLPTNNGVWSVTLSGSPTVMIAWVPVGSATVSGPLNSTCTDMYGNAVALSNNSVTMNESSGVCYFTAAPATYTVANLAVATYSGPAPTTSSDPTFGSLSSFDATAAGQSVTYVVPNVSAGTYDVQVGVKDYSNRGIWQLSASPVGGGGGSNIGPVVDEYNASTVYAEADLGYWSPASTSNKWFQFLVTGKNTSSNSYHECFGTITLTPLAGATTYTLANLTVATYSGPNAPTIAADQTFGSLSSFDATAVGQSVTYVVPSVSAGTYDVRVGVKDDNNRGIWQLSASPAGGGGGSNIGSAVDEYTATKLHAEVDLGNWTATSTSDKWFQFLITGKNASSSSYSECFGYIELIPQ